MLSFNYAPTATSELGPQLVRVRATDDGTPVMQSTIDVMINVVNSGGGDQSPPVCIATMVQPSRVDGEARDQQPLDSGIGSVALDSASLNLSLYVAPFVVGDPVVTWSLGRLDSLLPGSGTVVVMDVAGNIAHCVVAVGGAGDCNGIGIPDSVDIAYQTSFDQNATGVPDE
jgi:hypothetical protein